MLYVPFFVCLCVLPVNTLPLQIERVLPLSYAQERLWQIDRLQPRNCLYNLLNNLRLMGPLSLAAFEATLTEIVRRHEILRTTFTIAGGRPVQIVRQPGPLKPELIDLSGLPENKQEAEVSRLATVEAQRPFELTEGPLLRATLLRLSEEEHIALFTMHHIISDALSMAVFNREAAVLYDAFRDGRPSPLPELEIQYGDYAAWQQNSMTPKFHEQHVEHLRQRTHRGARRPVAIPAELTASLKELSLREGTTLFMTLLAAFQALLSFYAEGKDISVGAPISNRNRKETEKLIGCFTNSIVIRTDLSGDPSFRELMMRVKQTCLRAYAQRDVPCETLFQAMFVLDNAPMKSLSVQDLRIEPVNTHNGTALFDLSLCLVEKESEITGNLEFNVDLFDVQTIDRFVDQFLILIRNVVNDANQRLSTLYRFHPSRDLTPTTHVERKILAVWQKALGNLDIGIDDNFFDVGGNSFVLVKIHNALREMIRPDLPLMDLFKFPTIRSLVQHLDRQSEAENSFQSVYERVKKGKEAFHKRKPAKQATAESLGWSEALRAEP